MDGEQALTLFSKFVRLSLREPSEGHSHSVQCVSCGCLSCPARNQSYVLCNGTLLVLSSPPKPPHGSPPRQKKIRVTHNAAIPSHKVGVRHWHICQLLRPEKVENVCVCMRWIPRLVAITVHQVPSATLYVYKSAW
eukprot:scaffold2580_cov388-Prasinococcus_capsulatus_cf.AAC.24